MYKYIIIESKSQIEQYEPMIVSLFSEFIDISHVEIKEKELFIFLIMI